MDLSVLGYSPFFENSFESIRRPGLEPARVGAQWKGAYRVLGGFGERLAEVSGRFRRDAAGPAAFPAVGDWVAAAVEADGATIIHSLLPRRSRFARVAAGREPVEQVVAANIDTVFIVAGLDGDYSPRRLERYLTTVWDGGAQPVVVLNKIDACPDAASALADAEAVAIGAPVHAVGAREGAGLSLLDPYLAPGRTVALLGSSGVGKSTLLNRWLGEERVRTFAVRADDAHGRHTTTHRELYVLPGGGIVIDTPGMRELALSADPDAATAAFADIEELAATCRFRDCEHLDEPGCAVLAALDTGSLDPTRLASFRKLRREALFRRTQIDIGTRQAEREKIKRMFKEAERSIKFQRKS
jgi:ribosome biogenesis GTPase